ncbi:hypothetical protein QOZ80_9BG0713230 [Eleusine coracana subsp. coracana]|nr:hypothetical protein QOZ80_9BG0713230 [Eleusine coracana subsp. coracana]
MGDGSTSSAAEMQTAPNQQGDNSHCSKKIESLVQLPEDILHQIHPLMPIRDAAQAACVSRGFFGPWRFYPNPFLSVDSVGIKGALSDVE